MFSFYSHFKFPCWWFTGYSYILKLFVLFLWLWNRISGVGWRSPGDQSQVLIASFRVCLSWSNFTAFITFIWCKNTIVFSTNWDNLCCGVSLLSHISSFGTIVLSWFFVRCLVFDREHFLNVRADYQILIHVVIWNKKQK